MLIHKSFIENVTIEEEALCMRGFVTKILCVAFASLMFSVLLITGGSAAVEVEEGDWVKYVVEVDVEGPEELDYDEFMQFEWVKAEVKSVSGTDITLELVLHYANGTEETTVENGAGFILDPDLVKEGEVTAPIFGDELPMSLVISGSTSRTYAGARREVIYVDENFAFFDLAADFEIYWDNATGVLCEMIMSMSGELEGVTVQSFISFEMTETNIWRAGDHTGGLALFDGEEQWIWIAAALIGIAVVFVVVILLLRRKMLVSEVPPAPVA